MVTPAIYFEAVGRRKESIARVRLIPRTRQEVIINTKPADKYFSLQYLGDAALGPLRVVGTSQKFMITVQIRGGGIVSQSAAMAHGLARALLVFQNEWRPVLKKAGYLKRDPRIKERRKFGLKKARKAPQWSKR
ncbi:MAG: 30S ribosomal protein S9 [Patescibacteria group bacterium]